MSDGDFLTRAKTDAREVLELSFPIIVAMASHTLMGFVDTLILSRYGPSAVAAGGAAAGLAFTLMAFVFGTANCTSTFVAQSFGRGEPVECSRYAWQGIYFGIVVQALVLPAIVTPGPTRWLVGLFGHEPFLQPLERVYLRTRLFHLAGSASYAALTSFFQGIGRPRVAMVVALVANAVNALLDYALVFGLMGLPALGVGGAALATTISSYLQSALLLAVFLSRTVHARFRTRAAWRPDLTRLRRLLRIGLPAGLSFMLDVASWTIFTNVLIGRLGRDVLAANNITHQIIGLSFMPAIGINKGITVLVGQYIGKRDIRGAKRCVHVGIALAMAYMAFMGLCFVAFRGSIIRVFLKDPSAFPQIVVAGRRMLILAAIFQAFDAVGIVAMGALRGAGDTRFPAIVAVALSWGLLLPLGYVLTYPAGLGYIGAWTAAAVHIAAFGAVMFWRFASEAWRKIDIFQGGAAA